MTLIKPLLYRFIYRIIQRLIPPFGTLLIAIVCALGVTALISPAHRAWARPEDNLRRLSFDWESLEGAQSYDIEIGRYGENKPYKSEVFMPQNQWTGLLPPGKFWMRIRGRDDRGVPGEWSEKSEIVVKLPRVDVIRPSSDTVLSGNTSKTDVLFEWKKVPLAQSYLFTIESESKLFRQTRELKTTNLRLELQTAMKYHWTIQAIDGTNPADPKEGTLSEFILEGPPLPSPTIDVPETTYVRRISFQKSADAESVDIRLQRYDPKKKDWLRVQEWPEQKTSFDFPLEWPGGLYQIALRAQAKYRAPSPPAELSFEVSSESRTAERERQALLQKSLERNLGFLVRGQYIITQVQYQGVSYEGDAKPRFKALTGAAHLTLSKFAASKALGLQLGLGWGGILYNQRNTFLFEQEVSALWRNNLSYRWDLRLHLGLNRKDFPEATVDPDTDAITIATMNSVGVKIGSEVWFAWQRNLGLQMHGYYTRSLQGASALGTKLDGGQSLTLGLLGNYRWTPKISLLGGYTYTQDSFSFAGYNSITEKAGRNEISLTGHYLKLMVEYDF